MCKWILALSIVIVFPVGASLAADEGYELLVGDYVSAVNEGNVEKLKGLVHPESLACINDENRDYYDDYFSNEVEKHIPEDYKAGLRPIGKDEPLLMEGMFSYTPRPTHILQIDFERGPYDSVSIIRQVVELEGGWFMVLPCPTKEAVEKIREVRLQREEQRERARLLAKELKEPLLSELRGLLREGKRIQAWKRYSEETGESISMAKEVLSLIDIEGGKNAPDYRRRRGTLTCHRQLEPLPVALLSFHRLCFGNSYLERRSSPSSVDSPSSTFPLGAFGEALIEGGVGAGV